MAVTFRRAAHRPTPLSGAIAGGTGSGKTFSLLRLARGIAGPEGKVFAIDTENGRMLRYAHEFEFEHYDLRPPFTPERYLEALKAAEKGGSACTIVDSMSHEWNGEGGCHDMHEAALERMSKGDWKKAEKLSALAWRDPKSEHKKLMSYIIQSPVHLLFGLRAEQKLKVFTEVDEKGEKTTKFVDGGWLPICEKHFMYEMTFSLQVNVEAKGLPVHVKVEGHHAKAFPVDQQISEESGRLMAKFVKEGVVPAGKSATSLILRDGAGAEIKRLERTGAWLDNLEEMLNGAGPGEAAGKIWDANMDVFYSIQENAQHRNQAQALERCNGIGRLVHKLTQPEQGALV